MINAILYILGFFALFGLLTVLQNVVGNYIARGMNPEFRRWIAISSTLATLQIVLIYAAYFLFGERTGYGDFSDGLATNVYYLSLAANIFLAIGLVAAVVIAIKEYSSSNQPSLTAEGEA